MKVNFANHELCLHSSGIAFWPLHRTAIVSDLHLEKGSHFAGRGYFLPPYDSQATLKKLFAVIETQAVEQIIILGDCFHDPTGYARLDDEAKNLFQQLLRYQPIWIKGNHDRDFVPENFAAYAVFEKDGLVLRHEALQGASNEISGHFHPKVRLTHKGATLQPNCFVTDNNKFIMPAFGAYTGGLSVTHPAIAELFIAPPCVYALGKEKVYLLDNLYL